MSQQSLWIDDMQPTTVGVGRPRMRVNNEHRLDEVPWAPSPHHDARPDEADISLLVIHGISLPPGQFGSARSRSLITNLFLGQLRPTGDPFVDSIIGLEVSPHLCIFRDGDVVQYVAFNRRAWHAGVSSFEGRPRCNDYSIGIELEGDDLTPYTDAQYAALARVTSSLLAAYPSISPQRIVGHCDIAPGRKTDPGPYFDWPRFLAELEFPR